MTGVRPDWVFRVEEGASTVVHESDEFLGEDGISGPVRARMYRRANGSLRLTYSHWNVGSFLISADGGEIVWHPDPDPITEAARLCLLGRVLAGAMHQSGTLCLHGSGVALAEGAVAFIAPKYHGKSTLATALVQAGARLVTDDIVPVDLGPPVRVRPGVHRLRLWRDSATTFGDFEDQLSRSKGNKIYLDSLGDEQVMHHPERLRAIYLLAPRQEDAMGGEAVTRHSIDPVNAIVTLLANGSLGPLLERASQPLFERAASLAERVPVYTLQIVRDFGRLPAVVDGILGWHGGVPEGPSEGRGDRARRDRRSVLGSPLTRP